MSRTEGLQMRTLDIIKPSGRSLETDRQRQLLFGYLYGPEGRKYYRGIRDGSIAIGDLSEFRDAIDTHFFKTIARAHSIPVDIGPQTFYTLQQETAIGVVREITEKAFPHQERRFRQFKNEVTFKAPSPTTLFKILALPEDQVDRMTAFEVIRHLTVVDTAIPLDVRSKGADVRQQLADWNDIFNNELFEGPYGAGEDYQLSVSHDSLTNAVIRFHPKNRPLNPPKEGEHLATHNFIARRVKGYGSVFVDVDEEDVVSATIKALVKAANNGGVIRPTEDIRGSMKMTFVNLEDKPKGCQGTAFHRPHLAVLSRKVMEVMMRYMNITNIVDPSDKDQGQTDDLEITGIEFYTRNLPVPIKLVFLNRRDYLNGKYHVGVKSLVKGMPEPVYNGRAEELSELRSYYPLLPILFPQEIYGIDTQAVLRTTMDEVAGKLMEECES